MTPPVVITFFCSSHFTQFPWWFMTVKVIKQNLFRRNKNGHFLIRPMKLFNCLPIWRRQMIAIKVPGFLHFGPSVSSSDYSGHSPRGRLKEGGMIDHRRMIIFLLQLLTLEKKLERTNILCKVELHNHCSLPCWSECVEVSVAPTGQSAQTDQRKRPWYIHKMSLLLMWHTVWGQGVWTKKGDL